MSERLDEELELVENKFFAMADELDIDPNMMTYVLIRMLARFTHVMCADRDKEEFERVGEEIARMYKLCLQDEYPITNVPKQH